MRTPGEFHFAGTSLRTYRPVGVQIPLSHLVSEHFEGGHATFISQDDVRRDRTSRSGPVSVLPFLRDKTCFVGCSILT
jgi:hypothetical protein